MAKTPKELYEERDKRITDAIGLEIPDRVPLKMCFSYFPAKYTGITCKEAWYDADKWLEATRKTVLDYEPDGLFFIQNFTPGTALEYLDLKQVKWPGHGLPENSSHQYIDNDYMKEDEYDTALENMSDYMLRVYFPRISGALEPFRMLPPISSLEFGYFGLLSLAEVFARPEVADAVDKLQRAGREYHRVRVQMATFTEEIERLGFPVSGRILGGEAPFDGISSFLRGMKGAMLDMYRQPDKLLELCEFQLSKAMKKIEVMTSGSVNRRVFIPLQRGSGGFMSLPQFEKYYWPALKKLLLALVEKDLTPCPFFDGVWNDRLEYLLELPKGKVLCHFAWTDMELAKKVLGGHLCIMGNVPSTILQAGTEDDVKDYCKKLIDVCGKDGGFILTNMVLDCAKPQNVKAMVEFTKEYGVYN